MDAFILRAVTIALPHGIAPSHDLCQTVGESCASVHSRDESVLPLPGDIGPNPNPNPSTFAFPYAFSSSDNKSLLHMQNYICTALIRVISETSSDLLPNVASSV